MSVKIYYNEQELYALTEPVISRPFPKLEIESTPLFGDCVITCKMTGVRLRGRLARFANWLMNNPPKPMSRKQRRRRSEMRILRIKKILRENTAAAYAAGKALNAPHERTPTNDVQ